MKKQYRSFVNARKFVHSLKFTNRSEWIKYCKLDSKPEDIPSSPHVIYKNNGWISWGDFLGNIFCSYTDAKKFVHPLKLKNRNEWTIFAKTENKPKLIPADVRGVYKNNGWISWGDFLGTGTIAPQNRTFVSYTDAKIIMKRLKILSKNEFFKLSKMGKIPKEIPKDPYDTYRKQSTWISWGDFLGTGTIATFEIDWLPWPEAKLLYRKIAKENNLKNLADWKRYVKTHKLPKGLPAYPADNYTKERVWKRMQK